jgi:integrase
MTALRDALVDYLSMRRAFGYKLRAHEGMLGQFVAFLEQAGASTVTTELALCWAADTSGSENRKAVRLSMVRGFAAYLRTIDPMTEIPPTGILIARKRYAIPYLYSDWEIRRLVAEAAKLVPERRAMLHGTVIGLLAVTGMRVSEALGLDCEDVDLDAGVLTIRKSKFGKSRQVPLHPSTVRALARYERHREELSPRPMTAELLRLRAGQAGRPRPHRKGVSRSLPADRAAEHPRVIQPEGSRRQAHVRAAHAARLAARRNRCAVTAAVALHLSRAQRPL